MRHYGNAASCVGWGAGRQGDAYFYLRAAGCAVDTHCSVYSRYTFAHAAQTEPFALGLGCIEAVSITLNPQRKDILAALRAHLYPCRAAMSRYIGEDFLHDAEDLWLCQRR